MIVTITKPTNSSFEVFNAIRHVIKLLMLKEQILRSKKNFLVLKTFILNVVYYVMILLIHKKIKILFAGTID